ncbi:serine rich and transmembrane domain containing 1 [Osmerus mordax]|uniref:serine rich and transmembrane domain containing 1 n=1 Tax=Osmerus mordax TaxID=8014 RepID=UPI00350EB4CC
MSGMDPSSEDLDGAGISPDNGAFPRFSPTSSVSAAAAGSRQESVYVYVWVFLSLLAFLLTLLVVALHRLKNIITSSSSAPPDAGSEGGSSFTNMEICSISSQRSTVSSLYT